VSVLGKTAFAWMAGLWMALAVLAFGKMAGGVFGASTNSVVDLQSEYIVDSWQTDQGLPDNYINGIAQTPDGYLWIATFNGLARFNGVEFVTFDVANTPELRSNRIAWMGVDGAGRLWFCSEGGEFAVLSDGRFQNFSEKEGGPGANWARGFDVVGNFVCAKNIRSMEYLKFEDGHFQKQQAERPFELVFGNSRDFAGFGWLIDQLTLLSMNPKQPPQSPVPNFTLGKGWRMAPSRDGGMWVIAGRFQKFNLGKWEDYGAFPVDTDGFGDYFEDSARNLWVGTYMGEIWRVSTNRVTTRFKLRDAKIAELGRHFLQDAEGNIWIGAGGSGLLRLKPRLLKTYDSRNGLNSDVIRSVAEDSEGTLWVATVNGVNYFLPGDRGHARSGLRESALPWFVHAGRNDVLWIGSFAEGVFRYANGRTNQIRVPEGQVDPPTLDLLEAQDGVVYLATQRGLFTVGADHLEKCELPKEIADADVRSLAEDKTGRIYAGLNGNGLLRKTGAKWERFTTRDGLADDHVMAVHIDSEGAAWIGMDGHGLCRFRDGKFFDFSEDNLTLPRTVVNIIEDDLGHFWFASHRGIFRAEARELNAVAAGAASSANVIPYDRGDGMGSSQCTGSAWKARDGRIWFATMNGLTVVDPGALPQNRRPPPVVVEAALIDDKPAAFTDGKLIAPPGVHRLEIRYAGLNFTAPERVRYKYRLEGLEKGWVDAANRRFASFTRIPPGEYRFQVMAANNDGVWNTTGATLGVVAAPFFWQREWVQVLAAIAAIGIGIAVVRYWSGMRLRRRLAELEARHALENERGRISRDLHDSLGADLSQLALWSDLALQAKDRPGAMEERARDVSSLAREIIQNVEEIVWTVNPKNDSLDRFAGYLCEFAERTVTRAGLRFRWEAPDVIPECALPSDVRHHLFLVAKEALNNIVKHAGASEARLQLSFEDGRLEIVISDNGRGFGSERTLGNGLDNMRERAAACGGDATIQSDLGKGTIIRITAPLVRAAK
jgi:signal transduction histidine kinase/streptogramin lyase